MTYRGSLNERWDTSGSTCKVSGARVHADVLPEVQIDAGAAAGGVGT